MTEFICRMKEQGYEPGSCLVSVNKKRMHACRATLREEKGTLYRMITSIHLSRPENYLSIYQSGCNFSCRKCHSWYFSKVKDGNWYSPSEVLKEAVIYDRTVTLREPREKATAWHAHDTCRCCGSCVVYGKRSSLCPGELSREQIRYSPQGFGPARNIVAFTGGDITCCPEFYAECTRLIKDNTDLSVLIETNGYGLTPDTLAVFAESGVDAFWLDIKAYSEEKHKWLTGCSNEWILKLPGEITSRGFTLEVLSLYIPGLVETDELQGIARLLSTVDRTIPFTILAFFPEYRMKDYRGPTTEEMVDAYRKAKETGLRNIRLGNLGIFVKTEEDQQYLIDKVDRNAY